MENVLKDIRDTEEKSKKTVEDAEKSKADLISKARHESIKNLNQEKERIDKEKDAAIKARAKEFEAMRTFIAEKGKNEISKLEQKAKRNLSKTEEFIIRKFEEKISGS